MSSLPYSLESLQLIITFVKVNFPLVERELSVWRRYAEQIPCPELSAQALASIRDKTFHCQGGSIYGLYHQVDTPSFLRLVVALQTISDYLDNLCDRGGVADEKAFAWYTENLAEAAQTSSLIFIASNQKSEYPDNAEVISMTAYK